MTAQPVEQEDPRDPQTILHALPERERAEFLRQYEAAVDEAHDPAGYQALQKFLHVWTLTVIAVNKPGYYEAMEQARNWRERPDLFGVPIQDIAPDWEERIAVAQRRRQAQ